jgi:hypothetical protein
LNQKVIVNGCKELRRIVTWTRFYLEIEIMLNERQRVRLISWKVDEGGAEGIIH